MWPFTKKPQTAPGPQPAAGPPQLHFDWKGLPAIQRTIAEHPLTIPTGKFSAELSTHADPRAAAEPLGHHVSLEAPPGIVLGATRPQTRSDGPALVGRTRATQISSVQRFATDGDADLDGSEVTAAPDEGSAVATDQPRHLPAVPDARPSVPLTRVTAENGPLSLAPVQAMPEARPDAPDEPEVQRAAEPVAELPSYPRLTLGQARRLGLGAPMKHLPETATGVQRATDSMTSTAKPAAPAQPDEPAAPAEAAPELPWFPLDAIVNVRKEVIAPAPISRPQRIPMPLAVSRSAETPSIGEPLSPSVSSSEEPDAAPQPVPSSAAPLAVQPTAIEGAPSASAGQPSLPGRSDSDTGMPSRTEEPVGQVAGALPLITHGGSTRTIRAEPARGEAEEDTSAELPSLQLATMPPVQRAEATAPIASTGSIETPDEGGATGEAGEGTVAALPSLPLASTPALQRVATIDDSSTQAGASEDRGREVSRSTSAPRSWTAPIDGRMTAPLVTGRLPILSAVQRFADASGSVASRATDSVRGYNRGVTAGPTTVVPSASQSAVLEEPGPALATRDWVSPAPAIDTVVQRAGSSDLPLAFARPAAAGPGDSPVQRAAAGHPSFATESSISVQAPTTTLAFPDGRPAQWAVQRTAVADWSVSTSPEAPVQRAADVSEAPAGPAASHEDEDAHLQELAGKLYDRIRVRLRNELLVDRERAGLLTDLR